jgi:hypothetical protein
MLSLAGSVLTTVEMMKDDLSFILVVPVEDRWDIATYHA